MTQPVAANGRPRLGFLGLGWIGRHRLRAIVESGAGEVAALADVDPTALAEARTLAPDAQVAGSLESLLEMSLDGVVIATPSALHARETARALSGGCAVFCQKPLGRDASEVESVIAVAREHDRLLGVDFSYRYTEGMQRARELVRSGELGKVYAVDLTFHNAYGPDKPWFYDATQSGGGALMDLGIHLVDLALWVLDFPEPHGVASQLYAKGSRLPRASVRSLEQPVEDYVTSHLTFERDLTMHLTCSWRLHAGQDCVIRAAFYGERGAVSFHNVGGSFYDFEAELYRGTSRQLLASPPEPWGGRAAVAWVQQLARSPHFDPECRRLLTVSRVLDRIYAAPELAGSEAPCAS